MSPFYPWHWSHQPALRPAADDRRVPLFRAVSDWDMWTRELDVPAIAAAARPGWGRPFAHRRWARLTRGWR